MKRKAFTLLEILIATAIFATAMVLAGGVVAQTVRYQNKINYVRLVANENQRLSDLISNDIKLANTSGMVEAKLAMSYDTYDYKNGLALFNCGNECFPVHFRKDATIDDNPSTYSDSNINGYKANTLVIFYTNRDTNSTDHKIYYFDSTDKKIYLYSNTGDTVQLSTAGNPGQNDLDNDTIVSSLKTSLISSADTSDTINFGGFAPEDSSTYYFQPYILFDIYVETLDYSGTAEASVKAKTEIRTSVTGRSYNL